jgi:DNA-binding SARP family transcriptional activator
VSVEAGDVVVPYERFPGQQGRLVLAYLTLERGRPITRHELAEALWPTDLPPAWDAAVSAIVSKLRAVFAKSQLESLFSVEGARGCYDLQLPPDAWVDVEVAAEAIHEAEDALRRRDWRAGYGPSAVAHHIARRPFLPGESGSWIESRRDRLRDILLRALVARGEVYLANAEPALALQSGKELVALEPFRESGYRLIMRAHAAMGNVAEGLKAYEQCRRLIATELGVDPSPQTKSEYESLLRQTA